MSSLIAMLSNLAQIGVLVLGVVGYVYTVRPVFQTAQLQEQAARLELANGAAQAQITKLASERNTAEIALRTVSEELTTKQRAVAQLSRATTEAKERAATALAKAVEASSALQSQSAVLVTVQRNLAITLLQQEVSRLLLVNDASGPRVEFSSTLAEFVTAATRVWLNSKDLVPAAFQGARAASAGSTIPAHVWDNLWVEAAGTLSKATCEKPDFERVYREFQSAIAAAAPQVAEQAERQMRELSQEYAKQGKLAEFSPGYREFLEKQLTAIARITLDTKFSLRLRKDSSACADVAFEVLNQLSGKKD